MDIEQASVDYAKEHISDLLQQIEYSVDAFPDESTPQQRRLLDALATAITAAAIVALEMGGERC